MEKYIIKASGEQELFSIKKFKRSLERSGASPDLIATLAQDIEERTDLATTHDIYTFALNRLSKEHRPIAARYNLKNALIDLGPTGFPFEQFIGYIFNARGHNVITDQIMQGFCVDHEIDLIAHKDNSHLMLECKFHNRQGLKTDVKVTLYVKARFDDLKKQWEKAEKAPELHQVGVVTNTKFTSQAIRYGECSNMVLLSWSYPHKDNLAELIDRYNLHPITCLTTLTMRQKRMLVENNIILCTDLLANQPLLKQLKLTPYKLSLVIAEAQGVGNPTKK